jgi:NAD(P)-dependent dehydrogenase (short-subunit alcohol dehydrogenase family)
MLSPMTSCPRRRPAKIASQAGWPGWWHYIRADITLAVDVSRLIEACVEDRNLDVALCHAGMVGSRAILDYSEREWDDILAPNLRGAFLVAKAAVRSMVDRKTAGKIFFTSSWVQDVL